WVGSATGSRSRVLHRHGRHAGHRTWRIETGVAYLRCKSPLRLPRMRAQPAHGGGSPMDVQFVASVAPIVRDAEAARAFYADALGLSFEGGEGEYVFTQKLEGTKHFGLWPLSEAANACFGTTEWPADIPVPQVSIEFEVPDVVAAAAELTGKGYRLIHEARTEPWTQITARLLSPEGLLVAVCYTPQFHDRSDASS